MSDDVKKVIYGVLGLIFVLTLAIVLDSSNDASTERVTVNEAPVTVVCPKPVINITVSNTTQVINNREKTVVRENNLLLKEVSEQCAGVSINRLEMVDFTGSSMQPEIYSYYTGLMKKPDLRKSFVEGDVVVYVPEAGGGRVAHRVSGVYSDYLVVCPLNTYATGVSYCDHVAFDDVLGVVCGVLYG